MRIIRSSKKRKWKFVGITGIIIALLCSVTGALIMYQELKINRLEMDLLKKQMDTYSHMVYVAEEKISKGSRLTEGKIVQEIRYSDSPQEEFITEEEFGMILAMDIPAGTILTKQMVYEEEKSVRELLVSEVKCTEHLQTGDRIDVRIRYENAEDYVVLADKAITKLEKETELLLDLTEEEVLLLASAITDSGEFEETWLYAVKYPAFGESAASQVTYVANHDVLKLLGREQTEGESRTALELRLMQEQ